jgi:ankyrin repeat protein
MDTTIDLVQLIGKGRTDDVIRELERSPGRVNERNRSGLTPLMAAVRSTRSSDLVVVLLERFQANANICDNDGWTALHWSSNTREQVEQTELLISFGACVSAKEKRGWTPLHFAAYKGYLPVIKVLIKNGGDIADLNNDGMSCVQLLFQSWEVSARDKVWPPEKHRQATKEILDFSYQCTVEKRSQIQEDR